MNDSRIDAKSIRLSFRSRLRSRPLGLCARKKKFFFYRLAYAKLKRQRYLLLCHLPRTIAH